MPQPQPPAIVMGRLADAAYVLAHRMDEPARDYREVEERAEEAERIAGEMRRCVRG